MYIRVFNKFMKNYVEKLFYINNYVTDILELELNCSIFLESSDRKKLKLTKKNLDRMYAELSMQEIALRIKNEIFLITIKKFKSIIRNLISAIDYILSRKIKNTIRIRSARAFSYMDNDFLTDYLHYLNCCHNLLFELEDILEKHNVYKKTTLSIYP